MGCDRVTGIPHTGPWPLASQSYAEPCIFASLREATGDEAPEVNQNGPVSLKLAAFANAS